MIWRPHNYQFWASFEAPPRPSNARILVSRNKREGVYAGYYRHRVPGTNIRVGRHLRVGGPAFWKRIAK